MMRPLLIAAVFLMALFYTAPAEACRCINRPGCCSCLKGSGHRPDDPESIFEQPDPDQVYKDSLKDRQERDRKREAKQRKKAERKAAKRKAKLEKKRQAELKRQRRELQEAKRRRALKVERQRIERNLTWLNTILPPGAKPAPSKRDPELDRKKTKRRQKELSAKLARAARDHKSRHPAAISDADRRRLETDLLKTLELRLYPYDHSIQALRGIDHYIHGRGLKMDFPLSKIIIDQSVIKPSAQNTFRRELGRAPKGVPTRISFYHPYDTISIPNQYLLLGPIDLKIEADLIIRDNKFSLTNVEVVGGCDIYDANVKPDEDPVKTAIEDPVKNAFRIRDPVKHAIRKVLGAIPGTEYRIVLKGRQALPDMEGGVPSELPTEAEPPKCAQSKKR